MNRMTRMIVLTGALALALTVTTAERARASFLPVFKSVTSAGGVFTYNYDLEFATNSGTEEVLSGDFVTIYDFTGYVGTASGTTTPANFTSSVQFLGLNGPRTNAPDSATIPNITFTYTGQPITTTSTITGFAIRSTVGPGLTPGFFSGQNTKLADGTTKLGNVGETVVPTTPEPASVVLMGLGGLGLGALLHRRARA